MTGLLTIHVNTLTDCAAQQHVGFHQLLKNSTAAGGETDVKVDTSVNREHLTVFKWVLSQHTTEPQNM